MALLETGPYLADACKDVAILFLQQLPIHPAFTSDARTDYKRSRVCSNREGATRWGRSKDGICDGNLGVDVNLGRLEKHIDRLVRLEGVDFDGSLVGIDRLASLKSILVSEN
jgi:hypothetical protein